MELWGGIECTLNRVGSSCFDQLARSGHYTRGGDLDEIAALGIRTLRYPLLWERAATGSPSEFDWTFADERLPRLRSLGITPIAGLVHHGCGPLPSGLLSDGFAPGLANYAGQLAARFPWVEWYTPVNEPLTTARFSGLYGVWHPHARDDASFARILLNECRATVLAMRAIRRVNSAAKLMQTDDLGTIYSTPRLAYQARFENQRRWLAWDLLTGRVNREHPLHDYLLRAGIDAGELAWFSDNPCPPQIIGIDHYVTSDRFLDERLQKYPGHHWGGNGREEYADVDAVRVLARPGTSLEALLVETAQRFHLPVALAEVHIGCTDDEQVRWLDDAWSISQRLCAAGVDIRAVTAWALLGSFDWDCLLTAAGTTYEPGAFRVAEGGLRRTRLADFIATLARGGKSHDRPEGEGWWRRPDRFIYGAGISGETVVSLGRLSPPVLQHSATLKVTEFSD
jgi:dTDP-4-dehydrorhamnose reductase